MSDTPCPSVETCWECNGAGRHSSDLLDYCKVCRGRGILPKGQSRALRSWEPGFAEEDAMLKAARAKP